LCGDGHVAWLAQDVGVDARGGGSGGNEEPARAPRESRSGHVDGYINKSVDAARKRCATYVGRGTVAAACAVTVRVAGPQPQMGRSPVRACWVRKRGTSHIVYLTYIIILTLSNPRATTDARVDQWHSRSLNHVRRELLGLAADGKSSLRNIPLGDYSLGDVGSRARTNNALCSQPSTAMTNPSRFENGKYHDMWYESTVQYLALCTGQRGTVSNPSHYHGSWVLSYGKSLSPPHSSPICRPLTAARVRAAHVRCERAGARQRDGDPPGRV
jgi:hypothetical protein